ncbi:MAG: hypothetical protein PHY73_00615 [Candidatus Omnitrophica bacterium]|nr:hypothetical protein [Candidatus Omnitrophota bacterium]
MLLKIKQKTAQSTLEYAVLIVIIIGALIAMRTYLQRGIQDKLKSSTDDVSSEHFDLTGTNYTKITNSFSRTAEDTYAGQIDTTLRGEMTNVKINSTGTDVAQ